MRIYVAGPITKGDQFANVRAALDVGTALLARGHTPFVPHLTCFWHLVHPQDYETWMAYDLQWIWVCDGLFRVPGESAGADREVTAAQDYRMPVFHSLAEVDVYCGMSQEVV